MAETSGKPKKSICHKCRGDVSPGEKGVNSCDKHARNGTLYWHTYDCKTSKDNIGRLEKAFGEYWSCLDKDSQEARLRECPKVK